jgi:hypothetical protein
MTTILSVQANRRNALKSTGPRTIRGKLASSRNHLRNGVSSWKPVLLPFESRTAWEKLTLAELLETLVPAIKKEHNRLTAAERRAERELRRFRACSAVRPTGSARKFDRYERGLERSLTRALSPLREL